jgi:peptidoglycan hydrolase-like protein with peptidoglycan-binding domain
MSRSFRAWTGSVLVSVAACGVGRLRDRAVLGLRALPGTARPLIRSRCWLAVVLVLGLCPAVSPAHAGVRAHHRSGDRGSSPRRALSGVLALGSGYATPDGSAAVRSLQRALVRIGDPPGPLDGRYGPVTERAVLAFQTTYGLALDGIAGPRTLARLATAEALLYPGARDSRAVRGLQRALASAGDRPGPIDGQYGPVTEHAVRHFQTQHQLSVDGIAGPRTVSQLHPHRTSPPAPRASAHPRAAKPNPRPHHSHQPASAHRHAPRPPASVGHRHPGPSSSFAWLLLLGVVVLALVLIMWWFTRGRRPSRRISRSIALSASELGPEPAPLERGGAEAAFRPQDQRGDGSDESDLGVLLEDQGDLEGAEAAFRRSDQRGDAKGAFNLGVLLSRRGDLTEAKAAYARSDQRGDANAAFNLGVLLDNQGDLQGARAAFARADQRGDIKGALNLAVLLDDQGDPDGAEAAYARARKRGDSDDAELARAAPLEPYDRLQTHVEARLQSRTQQWLQAHGEVPRR